MLFHINRTILKKLSYQHVLNGMLCRNLSGATKIVTTSEITQSSDWETLYKFSSIRFISALNKLKIYQGIITVTGVPLSWAIEQSGHLPQGISLVFGTIGLSGTLTLLLFGKLSANLVGFLYTNQSKNEIKISYINFWGRRKDFISPISDIRPFSENQSAYRLFKFYEPIKFYKKKEKFILLHKYGEIFDFYTFEDVFGDHS